jgi:5-methylcytosine-specific restriction endonuclease McrA
LLAQKENPYLVAGPSGLELSTSMISEQKLKANRQNGLIGAALNRQRAVDRYAQNPKRCVHCSKVIEYEQRSNKFCSQSCAAKHSNTGRVRVQAYACAAGCSTMIKTGKYCSSKCAGDARRKYTPEEAAVVRKNRVREVSANYRAKLRDQTPHDADRDAIREFYANCPLGYEVDHIVPISKGGLHTLENLQYLTVSQNRRKSNKI